MRLTAINSSAIVGEALPDGHTADAVYIVLNPQHRKFLNEVEVRPLDYDYLFQLSPAPQRLYELLSFPMYGALSNNRPRVRLRYSEFCMFAPVTRYYDYDPVKKQMSKIHRPHRESGYIVKTEFQETTDSSGNRDWEMFYTPGPKAFREFRAFTNRPQPIDGSAAGPSARKEQLSFPPPAQAVLDLGNTDPEILSEITRRGITETKARTLLANLKPGQSVMDQIEYVDNVLAQAPTGKFYNPSGLYVKFIAENTPVPAGFYSNRKRCSAEDNLKATNTERARQAKLQLEYEEYRSQAVDIFIASLPSDEYRALIIAASRRLKRTFPLLSDSQIADIAANAVRADMKNSDRVQLVSFEDFCDMHSETADTSRKE